MQEITQKEYIMLNWGIIGCGHIAHEFMRSISPLENAQVIACAASNDKRSKDFALKYAINANFDNYQSMLNQRNIHAVYIATTHNFHFDHIMMSLRSGKHVLCEKPLTLNEQNEYKKSTKSCI